MSQSEDPLVIIEQIKAEEQITSDNVVLSHKISIKEDRLNRLKSQKEKLAQRLQLLEEVLAIKQERNNLLSENKKNMDRSRFSERHTSFFRVLRCLEAEIDRETARRDGMKSEINSLRGGVSEFTALRKRQMRQVEQFRKLEKKKIPDAIDYDEIQSLRIEARQKLKQIRPSSIGQASRIAGVSPADISVLLVYLGSK